VTAAFWDELIKAWVETMNIIDQLNKEQIEKLGSDIPEFGPGDTLRVHVRVTEGTRERVQVYEGVCIARKSDGLDSAFTVRKISFGEGVERIFPLYSPVVAKIEVARRGDVRRAKLYYLRGRTGKAARITEKSDWRTKPSDKDTSGSESKVKEMPASTAPAAEAMPKAAEA